MMERLGEQVQANKDENIAQFHLGSFAMERVKDTRPSYRFALAKAKSKRFKRKRTLVDSFSTQSPKDAMALGFRDQGRGFWFQQISFAANLRDSPRYGLALKPASPQFQLQGNNRGIHSTR